MTAPDFVAPRCPSCDRGMAQADASHFVCVTDDCARVDDLYTRNELENEAEAAGTFRLELRPGEGQ